MVHQGLLKFPTVVYQLPSRRLRPLNCGVWRAHVQPLRYDVRQRVSVRHNKHPFHQARSQYYRDFLLMQELLLDIRRMSEFYVFQLDDTPVHRAREKVDLLTKETPDFIPPTFRPSNSPRLEFGESMPC